MKTKIALIGFCAFALLMNTGCSTTKSTTKNTSTMGNDKTTSGNSGVAATDEKLPPVAEAPARASWGSNISPYIQ